MGASVRWRLAAMMVLVYAVQGAWWPMLAVHLQELGISGRGRGWIFATLSIASLATPLGAGQVADRLLATQRLLSLMYGLGAGLLLLVATGAIAGTGPLFATLLIYWLLLAPSYSLTNSLAFRNLERPREQFGGVRMWGTIGWMAVGWLVTGVLEVRGPGRSGHGVYEVFWVAAAAAAIACLYVQTLPHTPPLASGRRGIDLGEVRDLLRRPGVAPFLFAAFGVSMTTPFVYQAVPPYLQYLGLPRARVASAMTLGQILEVFALGSLPLVLRRLGHRRTLAAGIGAWIVYYGILAAHPPLALAFVAISMNGLAIALFHVAGPMFLDSQAPPHLRASSQGFYMLITTGLGTLTGCLLAGEITTRIGVGPGLFVAPVLINLSMLAAFVYAFPRGDRLSSHEAGDVAKTPTLDRPRGAAAVLGKLSPDPGKG
jgi:MFS family permease